MRSFRRLATAVALAGSALMMTAGLAAPANAAVKLRITCGTLSGTLSGNGTLTRCSGNTGKSGTMPSSTLVSGSGAITWASGGSTTISVTFAPASSDETDLHPCPSSTQEFTITGTVSADTTGSASVGAPVKAEACVDPSTGNYALEQGTRIVI